MALVLLIPLDREYRTEIAVACEIARCRELELHVVLVKPTSDQPTRKTIGPGDDDYKTASQISEVLIEKGFVWRDQDTTTTQDESDDRATTDAPQFQMVLWQHNDLAAAVLQEIEQSQCKLLVLPREPHRLEKQADGELLHLLSEARCQLAQIRSTKDATSSSGWSILVPVDDGAAGRASLRLAVDLVSGTDGQVTALYVEPNVDEYAGQVGQLILERNVRTAVGNRAEHVKLRVELGEHVAECIQQVAEDYDLVIVGASYHGPIHRWLARGVGESLLASERGPTVVSLRLAPPLSNRLLKYLDSLFRNLIPQLEREHRIDVVERIQSVSRWDFDFIALICLSTLIAAGGLIQNSAAVVIGAMLVAPLMTPLMGAGLSLVQGNQVLLRHSLLLVARGYLLALVLGMVVGWMVRDADLTTEMQARGAPGVLDLVVAFVSGLAAAYAVGRPKLLSALPGVAIAAALVPPIATMGITISIGRFDVALGAGLLFLTNIVAIILGTAGSFWAVGIRGSHQHGEFRWRTLKVAIALVGLMVTLGAYEYLKPRRVAPQMRDEISQYLAEHHAATLESLEWSPFQTDQLEIHVGASAPLNATCADALARIVARYTQEPAELDIHTHLVTRTVTVPP